MNRIIFSSLTALLLIMGLAAGYFYYQNYKNNNTQPEIAIPADAAFFIKGSLNSIFKDLEKTVYWKSFDKSTLFNGIKNNIILFDSLRSSSKNIENMFEVKNMTMSFHLTGASAFDVLYIIPITKETVFKRAWNELKINTSAQQAENERQYEGITFYELMTGNQTFTYTLSRNLFIGSFTPFLVEDAVRQQKVNKPLGNSEAYKTSYKKIIADSATYSIFINYSNLQKYLGLFLNDASENKINSLQQWADWGGLEIQFLKNRIVANGYINNNEGNKLSNLLKAQTTKEFKAIDILPANTAAFQTFCLSNLIAWQKDYMLNQTQTNAVKNYKEKLTAFEQKVKVPVASKFFDLIHEQLTVAITEPAGRNYDNNMLALFTLKDPKKSRIVLKAFSVLENSGKKKIPVEKFRNHEIANIPLDGLLPAMLGSNYTVFKNFFYTIHDNYLIVANQPSSLRIYIENITEQRLLKNQESWKEISNTWLSSFNYSIAILFPASDKIGFSLLENNWMELANERQSMLGDAKAFVYQVSNSNAGLYCHSSLVFSDKKTSSGANQLWSFKPDTLLRSAYSYLNTETEDYVLCQDAALNLYLINSDGKTEWKKQLDEPLQGKVFSVKLLDINEIQFLFSTTNKIFVLDKSGNSIGSYPIKLPAPSLTGIASVDNVNRNFFISCSNNQLYGYTHSGKPLSGWQYNTFDGELILPFQMNSLNKNTFLYAVNSNSNLVVYNSNGKQELKIELKQKPVGDKLFPAIKRDSLIAINATDSTGSVYAYYFNGEISVKSTSFSGNVKDFILLTNADGVITGYVYMTLNSVNITDADGTILYNYKSNDNMEWIKEIKSNDKSLIVAGTSTGKILLLNKKSELLKGFPVKGNAATINTELTKILVTEGNEAKLYELN